MSGCVRARQAPLSMGFSRQESWSGRPVPSPGDLPHPRIKPEFPVSPALQQILYCWATRAAQLKVQIIPKTTEELSLCLILRGDWAAERIYSLCAPTIAVKENSPLTHSLLLPTLVSPSTWLLPEHVSICPDTNEPRPWRLHSHGPCPLSRLCRGLRLHPEACREFVSRAGSCWWVCSGVGSISASTPPAPVWWGHHSRGGSRVTGAGGRQLHSQPCGFNRRLSPHPRWVLQLESRVCTKIPPGLLEFCGRWLRLYFLVPGDPIIALWSHWGSPYSVNQFLGL